MNYWMEEFIREQKRECLREFNKLNLQNISIAKLKDAPK